MIYHIMPEDRLGHDMHVWAVHKRLRDFKRVKEGERYIVRVNRNNLYWFEYIGLGGKLKRTGRVLTQWGAPLE